MKLTSGLLLLLAAGASALVEEARANVAYTNVETFCARDVELLCGGNPIATTPRREEETTPEVVSNPLPKTDVVEDVWAQDPWVLVYTSSTNPHRYASPSSLEVHATNLMIDRMLDELLAELFVPQRPPCPYRQQQREMPAMVFYSFYEVGSSDGTVASEHGIDRIGEDATSVARRRRLTQEETGSEDALQCLTKAWEKKVVSESCSRAVSDWKRAQAESKPAPGELVVSAQPLPPPTEIMYEEFTICTYVSYYLSGLWLQLMVVILLARHFILRNHDDEEEDDDDEDEDDYYYYIDSVDRKPLLSSRTIDCEGGFKVQIV